MKADVIKHKCLGKRWANRNLAHECRVLFWEAWGEVWKDSPAAEWRSFEL
jgi:hypothetical protein